MKYSITNQINSFEFHDAQIYYLDYKERTLSVYVKHLNLHKDVKQNPCNCDLEIDCARMVFVDFCVYTFEPGRAWKRDENGALYTEDPIVIIRGKEAEEKFVRELQNSICVLDLGKKDNERYYLDGSGVEPFFSVVFSFSRVTVEWDGYSQKAWYEVCKSYPCTMMLNTSEGEKAAELYIVCEKSPELWKQEEVPPVVHLTLRYGDKLYQGNGKDYLGMDAFADIQKQLPSSVSLKCCLSCRHGNLCPVGNNPGEVFCTKDVSIAQKSDLFFYTEDQTERDMRSKRYTDVCVSYQPQQEEFFTYSDFLDKSRKAICYE